MYRKEQGKATTDQKLSFSPFIPIKPHRSIQPVVTSVSATEFSSIPPSRPVAEVHPQTHVASSSPKPSAAAAFPPTTVTPPAGADIEKVTLPPPPVKSPVKKTSKVKDVYKLRQMAQIICIR